MKIKFLITIIFFIKIYNFCKDNETMLIKEDKSAHCEQCPKNCDICFQIPNDKIECAFCKEGFYLDNNQECKKCQKNCKECIGPNLNDCKTVKKGFFYSDEKKKIQKCNVEGCVVCHKENQCIACGENYYGEVIENKTTQVSKNKENYKCLKCGIEDCLVCEKKEDQIKNNFFVTCNLCKTGYGLVSGKCEKCTENCVFCRENTHECTLCQNGYHLDTNTNTCIKIKIDNCYRLNDDDNKKCDLCDSHFYLDKTSNCLGCPAKSENCNFCSTNEEDFMCFSCVTGFYLGKKGKCYKCEDKCHHCNKNQCFICEHNYFYDQETKKCEKCNVDNCSRCKLKDTCEECIPGFFFDSATLKCERCKNNCLHCNDSSKRCLSCPIDHFILEEEMISHPNTPPQNGLMGALLGIFGGIFNSGMPLNITQIKIKASCVKKCPKEHKNKTVFVNYSSRKCVVKIDENAPVVNLPNFSNGDNIHESVMRLKIHYDKEIDKIIKSSKEKNNINRSVECNYNGKLEYEIKGTGNYFICRCDESYIGDNCEISLSLYHNTQEKLVELLKKMENMFINQNKKNNTIFLNSLLLLNKFKYGRPVASRTLSLLKTFMLKEKRLDNKKKLYLLYDSLLLNLYDMLEDQRKLTFVLYNTNSDVREEKVKLLKNMESIIKMLQNSLEDHRYLHSFLEYDQSQYIGIDTYSFKLSEFKLKKYNSDTGFELENPNIDTAFQVEEKNSVKLNFDDKLTKNSFAYKMNIQIINYSSQLFENQIELMSKVLVSNVIYLKLLNPKNPHDILTNGNLGIKNLSLNFILLFIPAFVENIEDKIFCEAFTLNQDSKILKGKLILDDGGKLKLDEDKQSVECQFENIEQFNEYYFAVTISKTI